MPPWESLMPPYKAMPRIKGASIFFCHSRAQTESGRRESSIVFYAGEGVGHINGVPFLLYGQKKGKKSKRAKGKKKKNIVLRGKDKYEILRLRAG